MSQFSQSTNVSRSDTGIHNAEGNVAGRRAAGLTKQRNEQKAAYEAKRKEIERAGGISVARVDDKFDRQIVGGKDSKFREATYGLKTRQEFLDAKLKHLDGVGDGTKRVAPEDNSLAAKIRRKKMKKRKKVIVSFGDDDEDDDNGGCSSGATIHSTGAASARGATEERYGKVGKNPAVQTDFLPDCDREDGERKRIVELKQEWKLMQSKIKREKLEVTYSFWDGSGHRRSIVVMKGTTIGKFLEAVRQDLAAEFPELRGVSSDSLMYVKEDLIIPQYYSFYDLIASKARGKSGPLFHFDIHEDIRLVHDARIEKDESHPGKICERHWFERNKHIFPASRWEVYDPAVVRTGYTTHGSEVRGKNAPEKN